MMSSGKAEYGSWMGLAKNTGFNVGGCGHYISLVCPIMTVAHLGTESPLSPQTYVLSAQCANCDVAA